MINFVLRILIYLAVAVIGWSVGLVIPDPLSVFKVRDRYARWFNEG